MSEKTGIALPRRFRWSTLLGIALLAMVVIPVVLDYADSFIIRANQGPCAGLPTTTLEDVDFGLAFFLSPLAAAALIGVLARPRLKRRLAPSPIQGVTAVILAIGLGVAAAVVIWVVAAIPFSAKLCL
jgi:hypothetical protein